MKPERVGGVRCFTKLPNWNTTRKDLHVCTTDSLITCSLGMGAAIQKTYDERSVVWMQPPSWRDHDDNKVWSQPSQKTQVWSQPSINESCNINPQKSQPSSQQTRTRVLRSIPIRTKYKSKHVNTWAEVEHAWTSSDYQSMMKTVNKRERGHQ